MIKLQVKRFELNFLLKLSDPKSNSMLTLGYLTRATRARAKDRKAQAVYIQNHPKERGVKRVKLKI